MFKDNVVLITGGSSGIGAETAFLFAQNGADIVITYKENKSGAESVVKKIENFGQKALAIQADLIDERQAKEVVDLTFDRFGKINILINNAGRYINGDEWDGSSEIWLKSLQQNLVSMLNISKYVIKIFQTQKNGVIVNVASKLGIDGGPFDITYGAAKAGVINITKAYGKLLSSFGRANCVSPGATNAGYWLTAPKDELEAKLASRPNHKLTDPKVVAEKIIFLASDDAKDINGHNLEIIE